MQNSEKNKENKEKIFFFVKDKNFYSKNTNNEKNIIKKYICNICNKQFLSISALKLHQRFVHEHQLIFTCTYNGCGKIFRNKYRLETHLRKHQGIKLFKCEICEKSFSENGTLLTHYVIHSNYKPFSCEFCSYKCKTNPQLKHHYLKEHNESYFYKCFICKIKYKKKAELKHHMLIHNNENNNNNVLNNGFNVKNIETEFQKQIQTNNNNNIDPIISNEISFNI
jgi:uncharacterized Zn-finger protein